MEEEIELSLGLAIGGGCKKRLRSEDRVCEVPENGEAGGKEGEEQVDLVKRREMQAQRRQEARRKREEKKQMKRGGLKVSSINQKVDDGVIVEESDGAERALKRKKIESGLQPQAAKSDGVEGADQSCSNASEFITSEQAAQASASAFAFPIYTYPSFQYVPFAFPCIAPSVYRAESDGTNKISAPPQTVSFRPFLGGKKSNDVNLRGAAATVNGRNGEGNVKDLSNGSLCCCSSAISENRSISSQDGSSSDSGSHLSCPKSGKTELHSSSGSDLPRTSKRKALSNRSTTTDAEKANNAPPATAFQPTPAAVSKQDASFVEQKPAKIPILRSTSLPQPKTPITKDNKVDSNNPGKPPRPQPVDNQKTSSPLSQMPCVSTTGNGPDGKTITGFLYRYNTTAEVSIVCVCHGESFSPAEFVQHAGGIDISHPLRHITVVPSAF